jgi:hypothetical protein
MGRWACIEISATTIRQNHTCLNHIVSLVIRPYKRAFFPNIIAARNDDMRQVTLVPGDVLMLRPPSVTTRDSCPCSINHVSNAKLLHCRSCFCYRRKSWKRASHMQACASKHITLFNYEARPYISLSCLRLHHHIFVKISGQYLYHRHFIYSLSQSQSHSHHAFANLLRLKNCSLRSFWPTSLTYSAEVQIWPIPLP